MKKQVILCVDDEQSILDSLKIELSSTLGNAYLIESAQDGKEALELIVELLAEQYEIPLIICDYIMPNIKGDEVLKQTSCLSPKTLNIMLTGQADIKAIGNAVNYGNLYRYIAKPWESLDFGMTIKEALQRYTQERKLEQFYADLEAKIVERTRELHTKNQVLIKLNQEKNEFLGIVAHDLKNPLAAIQGLIKMIQTGAKQKSSHAELLEYAMMIDNISHQMFELITNLLDVNAIESDQMTANLVDVDILPLVQEIVKNYSEKAKAKKMTLQFERLEDQYIAFADSRLVQQIIENLLSNALKYAYPETKFYLRLIQADTFVRCEVEDEGPGLSLEDQRKLFSKFTRLSTRPTGNEHSTGLGLFIVKKLADKLGARVWCDSELNKGTTFIVEFPIGKEPLPPHS